MVDPVALRVERGSSALGAIHVLPLMLQREKYYLNVGMGLQDNVTAQHILAQIRQTSLCCMCLNGFGPYQSGSDTDLCVEGGALTLEDLFEIENRIDDLLLPWKVDLSLRHRIHNPELREHIDRVGVKLFETDSSRALSANS